MFNVIKSYLIEALNDHSYGGIFCEDLFLNEVNSYKAVVINDTFWKFLDQF